MPGLLGPRPLMTSPETSTRWCSFPISVLWYCLPYYPLPLAHAFCKVVNGTLIVERNSKSLESSQVRKEVIGNINSVQTISIVQKRHLVGHKLVSITWLTAQGQLQGFSSLINLPLKPCSPRYLFEF